MLSIFSIHSLKSEDLVYTSLLHDPISVSTFTAKEGCMLPLGLHVQVALEYDDPTLSGLRGFICEVTSTRECPYTVYLYGLDIELRFKESQLEPIKERAVTSN